MSRLSRRQLIAAGAGAAGAVATGLVLDQYLWPLLDKEDLIPGSPPTVVRAGRGEMAHIGGAHLFLKILGRGAAGPAYIAGKRLGKALGLPDVSAFLKLCEDLNIGKIRVPKQDDRSLYVDVYECVTCAGLTPVGRKLCSFEGGLIAGVMESIVK